MKNIISLDSRDGTPNILRKLKGDEFKDGKSYKLETPYNYRMGKINGENLFIDPSGGPLLCKDQLVGNNKISRVYIHDTEGAVIEFE